MHLFDKGNLFKLTTVEEFAAGGMEGVEQADCGNGAIRLTEGFLEGTFITPEYSCRSFNKMVACWNASINEGSSIEILARARIESTGTEREEWTDWLTWGEFSPYILRGTTENKKGRGAWIDQDTFTAESGLLDGFQMKAVIRRVRVDVESPVLRELTMTFRGGAMIPTYAEETKETPARALCASPAYSQEIRWNRIADSICSPTTMTVILNTINPGLDLLPEEYALNSKDQGEDIFGNWSFCCAFAGCYGYECYCQYGSKDIVLQEIAKGHPVGLSLAYTPESLTGAYGSTDGHLITLIGYEYEDGIIDDDHLRFFSSDSYSAKDCESYRRYKWSELSRLDGSFVCYIVPSSVREEECSGVQRVTGCKIVQKPGTDRWMLTDESGNQISLDHCSTDRGCVAYTIEGVGTDMTVEPYESSCSIVYPNAVNASANKTFFYLEAGSDSCFHLNKEEALRAAGVSDGRFTVYAFSDNGYLYIGEL